MILCSFISIMFFFAVISVCVLNLEAILCDITCVFYYSLSDLIYCSSLIFFLTHPIYNFLSYHRLSPSYFSFVFSLSSLTVPSHIHETHDHPGRQQVMIDEM